mgnify:CR=1 FL=1|jgi:hypothetical protein
MYSPGKPGKDASRIVVEMVQATNPYVPPQPEEDHIERIHSARKRREELEKDKVFPSKFKLVARPLETIE